MATKIEATLIAARTMYKSFCDTFFKHRHPDKVVETCLVYSSAPNELTFFTPHFVFSIDIDDKACKAARKIIGENMLMRLGVPSKEPPRCVLLPTPSMAIALGHDRISKFIKDWVGQSMIGDVKVVEYSVLM